MRTICIFLLFLSMLAACENTTPTADKPSPAPVMEVSVLQLSFEDTLRQLSLTVTNTGDADLALSVNIDASWLEVDTGNSIIAPQQNRTLLFSVERKAVQECGLHQTEVLLIAQHHDTARVTVSMNYPEPNTAPVAQFTVQASSGNLSTVFMFDASASSDDHDSQSDLQYAWQFEADGIYTPLSNSPLATHNYSTGGAKIVTLRLRDTQGIESTISDTIQVAAELTDSRDNRTYAAVTIGSQTWMSENLAWLPEVCGGFASCGYWVYGYKNGTNLTDATALVNYTTYGVLYNYTNAANACPEGWHLPDDQEWKQLEEALGMDVAELNQTGFRSQTVGNALKSTSGWYNNGNGTNQSGFTGLPGGNRYYYEGVFYFESKAAYWWSSSHENEDNLWIRVLSHNEAGINRITTRKDDGNSVRCVKDAAQ